MVALALLPVQYYVPDLYASREEQQSDISDGNQVPHKRDWYDTPFAHFPPLDLIFAAVLFMLAFATYLCEWIQRKLMERRIVKVIFKFVYRTCK